MTETTALITLNHPFHVASGTIGKPLPGREVKLGPDGEVLVRGAMISDATWSGGQLRHATRRVAGHRRHCGEEATGELRFLGRKSEVIVTAAGVNIHPEDIEAAIEQEPGVTGCAVVPVETATGPEPYAVLAMRGSEVQRWRLSKARTAAGRVSEGAALGGMAGAGSAADFDGQGSAETCGRMGGAVRALMRRRGMEATGFPARMAGTGCWR